jgi:hypothetical protein
LFKFCRGIRGFLGWLKDFDEPLALYDIRELHESADAVYGLLGCKHLYSEELFDFIEFTIATPLFS